MANEEHLKILKKDVNIWNRWRRRSAIVDPDLSGADLSRLDLKLANLSWANLQGANLVSAELYVADLREANLTRVNLQGAQLIRANLQGAHLIQADLSGASLQAAILHRTELRAINLRHTRVQQTVFAGVDLSEVEGLGEILHGGPSEVDISTIYLSRGKIPIEFLRGAGVPEEFIAYAKSLFAKPIEFYSCFISYSSKDQEFAERLYSDLQSNGVRCWFAPEDLKIGDPFRRRIDDAIRAYDKLLIVLSSNSVKSRWVEKEVETAFERERQQSRIALFPIRLDGAVMETQEAWAADIRRIRHIGDFSAWKDHNSYKSAFVRLLRDLKADSRAESAAQD